MSSPPRIKAFPNDPHSPASDFSGRSNHDIPEENDMSPLQDEAPIIAGSQGFDDLNSPSQRQPCGPNHAGEWYNPMYRHSHFEPERYHDDSGIHQHNISGIMRGSHAAKPSSHVPIAFCGNANKHSFPAPFHPPSAPHHVESPPFSTFAFVSGPALVPVGSDQQGGRLSGTTTSSSTWDMRSSAVPPLSSSSSITDTSSARTYAYSNKPYTFGSHHPSSLPVQETPIEHGSVSQDSFSGQSRYPQLVQPQQYSHQNYEYEASFPSSNPFMHPNSYSQARADAVVQQHQQQQQQHQQHPTAPHGSQPTGRMQPIEVRRIRPDPTPQGNKEDQYSKGTMSVSDGSRQPPQRPVGKIKMGDNGQKKHVCMCCNKRFNRPSSLQTHMSVHTGRKPYKCPEEDCGRRFSVSSNLKRHIRTHEAKTTKDSAGHRRNASSIRSIDELEPSINELDLSGSLDSLGSPLTNHHQQQQFPQIYDGRQGITSHDEYGQQQQVMYQSAGYLPQSLPNQQQYRRPSMHRAQSSASSYHAGLPGSSQMTQVCSSPEMTGYTSPINAAGSAHHRAGSTRLPMHQGLFIQSQSTGQMQPGLQTSNPYITGTPQQMPTSVSMWSTDMSIDTENTGAPQADNAIASV